ncbi:extracellular solute-binding protein [Janthinobacterium fluminis]|uniref:Extracellular solute-binding protein n=1 Tax=Janthinobacterium fluminis TaxID=2987524 RepID=A0ABT5K3H3_9BURK|nr:extracellular solute-binding protein [Janthinobacterium fluminis]MDC8759532.1 extracellular solute-binding protein [Janthinobacterium fluminis]
MAIHPTCRRVAAALLLALAPSAVLAEPVHVLAAGSLRLAFGAIIARWQALHPESPVTMENGPAGWLRERIEKGQPYDVYASAALAHAQTLSRAGLAGPAVLFARNNMCALVKAGTPVTSDTVLALLLAPSTRVATSTPKSDPGGDYAWELFRRLDVEHPGAYAALTARAQQRYGGPPDPQRPSPPSSAALIAAGDIDMALGYCSGMRQGAGSALKSVALPALAPVADYGLAVAPQAGPAAAAFALFVLSPAGQRVLEEHGFHSVGLPANE